MAIKNTNLGGADWDDGITSLDGAITDSDTTITVLSTTDFESIGNIKIEDELISYTGTTATTFTGCTRGAFKTTAISHADTTAVFEREGLKGEDLNDTFNAVVERTQTLSVFYLNDELYDVYDDFNSYSVGALPSTLWTTTTSGADASSLGASVVTSTNAGGSANEVFIRAEGSINATRTWTATITSNSLANNKHVFARCYSRIATGTGESDTSTKVSIDGSNYYNLMKGLGDTDSREMEALGMILVVAKGSNVYDLYVGGKKVQADVTVANLEISFQAKTDGFNDTRWSYLYIDDVRQSKTAIQ